MNPLRQAARHLTEKPRPLRELNPHVPEDLGQVVGCMLAGGYPTAGQAAQALQAFLTSGPPLPISPDNEPRRSSRTTNRRRSSPIPAGRRITAGRVRFLLPRWPRLLRLRCCPFSQLNLPRLSRRRPPSLGPRSRKPTHGPSRWRVPPSGDAVPAGDFPKLTPFPRRTPKPSSRNYVALALGGLGLLVAQVVGMLLAHLTQQR